MPEPEEYVTKAITLINSCINTDARFHTKKVMDRLLTISAVGVLVKDLIAIVGPKRPDKVMTKLNELDRKIGELSNKMSILFDDLKSFHVAHDFFARTSASAGTLLRYMKNTISNPCADNMNLFRTECERTPPLRLAREFMERLKVEETNPLKMAMNADKLKTRRTFQKWKNIIDGVLAQFLVLETYLNGMFWNRNMIGPNELAGEIKEVSAQIDHWDRSYHRENRGWEGIQQLMVDTQDHNQHLGNWDKADIIQIALDGIMTNDTFYVLVFDDKGGDENWAFEWQHDNQCFRSYSRGGCSVVVYRTTRWNDRKFYSNQVEEAMKKVNYPNRDAFFIGDRYQPVVTSLYHELNKHCECGFVAMIRKRLNTAIRWVNCSPKDLPWGPGWWKHVKTPDLWQCLGLYAVPNNGDEFLVVVGFK